MNLIKMLIVLFVYIGSTIYSENAIPEFSEEEKENLSHIFEYLFKSGNFSYTLFSDKPVSFEDIQNTSNGRITSVANYAILLSYQKPINILERSWQVWQAKRSNYHFKNYIFLEKRNVRYTTIILINNDAFSKVFENNQGVFQEILGSEMTKEKLLDRIKSDEFSLYQSVNNNQRLLGILLGYGTYNSMAYQEKLDLKKFNLVSPEITKVRLSKIKLQPTYPQPCCLHVINPVGFMANMKHPETKMLMKKYETVKTKASKAYNSQNFVEVILSKIE